MREQHRLLPVSVVIPAFNAHAYLAESIASVRRQTRQPAEIIVVDDGSSDGTAALAARLGARVFASVNRGPAAARNTGARIATQPWLAFLDADDLWLEEKLALQFDALERWPDASLCFTDYDAIDARGARTRSEGATHAGFALLRAEQRRGDAARIAPDVAVNALVRSMFVRQSSVVANREQFMRSGGYDERMRLGEDYELFLRLSAVAPVVSIERALVVYQRRESSLSADSLAEVCSIDRLWETMLARPDRYPATMLALVRSARAPTLRRGAAKALRLGKFGDARSLAEKALHIERSPASMVACAVAGLLGTPAGSGVHRAVRTLWRARHSASPSS